MNRAIISGASGLVGKSIAQACSTAGIPTLGLGRELIRDQASNHESSPPSHIVCDLRDLEAAYQAVATQYSFVEDGTVFYHCAWEGQGRLSRGTLEEQMHNASMATNAVLLAVELGCSKFVAVGSLLETIYEADFGHQKMGSLTHDQENYALAKVAARDMAKLTAYLNKIPYVHTRLSVPIAWPGRGKHYVEKSLAEIAQKRTRVVPKSNLPHSIIFLEDAAQAFRRIGQSGRNGADYFVAGPEVATLQQYFDRFLASVRGEISDAMPDALVNPYTATQDCLLSAKSLLEDTQFRPKFSIVNSTVVDK